MALCPISSTLTRVDDATVRRRSNWTEKRTIGKATTSWAAFFGNKFWIWCSCSWASHAHNHRFLQHFAESNGKQVSSSYTTSESASASVQHEARKLVQTSPVPHSEHPGKEQVTKPENQGMWPNSPSSPRGFNHFNPPLCPHCRVGWIAMTSN